MIYINGVAQVGVSTHAELPDVSTPHVLADLESAVCSETEAGTIADGKITTHGTGAKHRWTDEKLRKGAGAGANPDEIDVPTPAFAPASVGDVLLLITEESSNNTDVYVKKREFKIARKGAYRIKFDLKTAHGSHPAYGRIYKNGVAIGIERSTSSTSYVNYSEDIAGFDNGDLIQLYVKNIDTGWGALINNFALYADKVLVVEDTEESV